MKKITTILFCICVSTLLVAQQPVPASKLQGAKKEPLLSAANKQTRPAKANRAGKKISQLPLLVEQKNARPASDLKAATPKKITLQPALKK